MSIYPGLLYKVFFFCSCAGLTLLMYFIDHSVHDFMDNGELDDSREKNLKSSSDKEYLKEGNRVQPFPESGDDAYEFQNVGLLNSDIQHSTALKAEEDPESNIDLALSNFHQEYEVFELRIIHRKNRFTISFFFDFPLLICMLFDPFLY